MARVGDLNQTWSKRKAIVAFFPYVVWQDRGGDRRVVDAFLGIAKAPEIARTFMAQPITRLFEEASPDSPNQVVTLLSRYAHWEFGLDGNTVTWWAAAVMAVPYTEEVGQCVVDTLLQIASNGLCIPIDIWAWLKRQPSLPPICEGRSVGTRDTVVRRVRELGDIKILESYFLLVWSEWDAIDSDAGLIEMCTSIRRDLGGIGMDREVLIKRLDHVLGQLDRGRWYLNQHNPGVDESRIRTAREQYRGLRRLLLGVDREALEILTSTSFRLINSFDSLMRPQNPTRRSSVPSPSHARSHAPTTFLPRPPNSVLHLHTGSTSPISHRPTLQTVLASCHLLMREAPCSDCFGRRRVTRNPCRALSEFPPLYTTSHFSTPLDLIRRRPEGSAEGGDCIRTCN